MKTKGVIKSIFFTSICVIFLNSCSSKSEKVRVPGDNSIITQQNNTVLMKADSAIKDTLNITQSSTANDSHDLPPYSTASLLNWKEYFRTNNKYKDWDSKDAQKVFIRAIVEKDGAITDVIIVKKCNNDLLNNEAIRLIRDAKANGAQIEPARNEKGNPIRSNWTIAIDFPPK